METRSGPLGRPPRVLEAAVDRLFPPPFRHVIRELAADYSSLGRYLRQTLEILPHVFLRQVRCVFTPSMTARDAALILLAFVGAPAALPIMFVLIAALSALVLRDVYTDARDVFGDAEGIRLALTDAAVAIALVVVSQALTALVVPALAFGTGRLVRGSAIGFAAIASHRFLCRWRRPARVAAVRRPVPGRDQGKWSKRAYRAVVLANLVWMLSGVGLLISGVNEIPASVPGLDFVLGILLVSAFVVGYRPQLTAVFGPAAMPVSYGIVPAHALEGDLRNPATAGQTRKRDGLAGIAPRAFTPRIFAPRSSAPRGPGYESWSRLARWLVFSSLAVPLAAGLWALLRGAGEGTGAIRLGLHLGVLFVLTVLWTPVHKANLWAARVISDEARASGRPVGSGP